MAKIHYHVGMNVPGYLPESDVEIATTKGEAVAVLQEMKERLLDADWDIDSEYRRRMHGDARRDLGYHYVNDQPGSHDLGLSLWADECMEDCQEEEES